MPPLNKPFNVSVGQIYYFTESRTAMTTLNGRMTTNRVRWFGSKATLTGVLQNAGPRSGVQYDTRSVSVATSSAAARIPSGSIRSPGTVELVTCQPGIYSGYAARSIIHGRVA